MSAIYRVATIASVCLTFTGCYSNAQREARDLASQITATMAATQAAAEQRGASTTGVPVDLFGLGGRKETMPDGCYVRATINGKRWEAAAMTPDLDGTSLLLVNGRNKNGFIHFYISGRHIKVEKPRNFSERNAVLYWDENDETWSGKSGSVTVHKVDKHFIEGTFNFTADQKGRYCVCTEGKFRIPTPPRALAD
jgi:hypothetical protein